MANLPQFNGCAPPENPRRERIREEREDEKTAFVAKVMRSLRHELLKDEPDILAWLKDFDADAETAEQIKIHDQLCDILDAHEAYWCSV